MEKEKKNSKDTTSNLFNRYVWLVDTIYRKGNITFGEINKLWTKSNLNFDREDFPLRTFHNHRKAIEEMFDLNIECDKRNNKYYIENADDVEKGGVRSWLLNTFAVNNMINESHKIKQRILFEQIPAGQKYLTTIIEAMRDNLSIEITYQRFWQEAPDTFEIYPYCIKIFKQRWYVIAYNTEKKQIRTYALDRIKEDILITENTFKMPKNFDGKSFFADSFGIIADDKVDAEIVKIKVCSDQNKYIKTLPLHHSQVEEDIDDYTIFSYFIKPTYDFRQELLSHGANVEVLSPQWFREWMSEEIKRMSEMYNPFKTS